MKVHLKKQKKKKKKKYELALKHSGHMSKMKFNQHLQGETEIGK